MKFCIRSKVGKTGVRHWQVLSGGVVVVSAHSFEKAVEMLPDEVLKARRERERADEIYDSLEPTGRHSRHWQQQKMNEHLMRLADSLVENWLKDLTSTFGGAVVST